MNGKHDHTTAVCNEVERTERAGTDFLEGQSSFNLPKLSHRFLLTVKNRVAEWSVSLFAEAHSGPESRIFENEVHMLA